VTKHHHRRHSGRGWLATLVLIPLALTGCTVGSGASTAATGAGADRAVTPTIALVTHGNPGDSFWDVVKSGAEQAGREVGATVTYQGDGDPVRQSQLIDSAVAAHPDGLIVSMANPDGVRQAVEHAVAAGIPVITINSGLDESLAVGAQTHVGQSEFSAGQAAGTRLAEAGARRVICVIHEAGNSGLEDRCRGAADTLGGTVTNVQVDVANLADAQTTITATLLADPAIDGVLSLNPGIAVAASNAVTAAGSRARLATFDLSADVTALIESGAILFAVDQQPYSQGYLPVVFLALQKRNGDVVGGGRPVFSGPGFVTKENAAQVAKFAAAGSR
jgi:simple sugar transport system substrate-binding protein